MKDIKNIFICGIGAIGSIYAEKIQRYNPENLRVLVDEKRLEKYKKNPLIFNGKQLDFNYILPSEKDFTADLVIIATKYDGLNEVLKNLENFVGENTLIMSLLNGVTSEKIIAAKYGSEKLVYSYVIGHSAVRQDRNITHDDVNTIVFDGNKKVKEFFDKVGINYEIPDDIIRSMWLKFMLNAASNQTSAVLKYTFGEMMNNKKCMEFLVNIMKEVQQIARAEGVKNTETMVDETLQNLNKMLSEGKTSMLQDVEANRKTEVDMFAGVVIDYGKKHKIPTPYNLVLKGLIDAISY